MNYGGNSSHKRSRRLRSKGISAKYTCGYERYRNGCGIRQLPNALTCARDLGSCDCHSKPQGYAAVKVMDYGYNCSERNPALERAMQRDTSSYCGSIRSWNTASSIFSKRYKNDPPGTSA